MKVCWIERVALHRERRRQLGTQQINRIDLTKDRTQLQSKGNIVKQTEGGGKVGQESTE